ncbi:MAG: hypothetical protein GY839_01530 [candidate division Zixibacteria bacterium]|nr:hypothetical protein [candidate division Zixibacteria bacterium]
MFGKGNFQGLFNSLNLNRFANLDLFSALKQKTSMGGPFGRMRSGSIPGIGLHKNKPAIKSNPIPDSIEKMFSKPGAPATRSADQTYGLGDLLKALKKRAAAPEVAQQPQSSPETVKTQTKWMNMVKLNMDFNLSELEQSIGNFIEDAQDGEVETTTLTNLNMGLHVDLRAKAKFEQKIQSSRAEGNHDSHGFKRAKVTTREKQAMAIKMQARNFEAEMFYKESMKTKYKMKQEFGDGFMRTSRKLAMHYTQDFSFNFTALNQYNTQAVELQNTGDAEGYINSTEALVDNSQVSGELINQFFGVVDEYLSQAESKVIDKVNSFFDKMAQSLGIDSKYLDQNREMLIGRIGAFFDKVEQVADSAMDKYIQAPAPPEPIPEPGPIVDDPALEPPEEEVAIA